MKTYLPLIFILLSTLNVMVFGQTLVLETKNFDKRFAEGKYDPYEYQNIAKKWRTTVENVGGYPEMPFDTTLHDVNYKFIFTFDSLDKNIIYNRILEWMSLRYSSLTSVLDYQDYDLGKIIIKGRDQIKAVGSSKTYYLVTYRFTIVDDGLKIEITQLSFDFEYAQYPMGETTYYNYVINEPVKDIVPISDQQKNTWEQKMKILKEADSDINLSVKKLEDFIRNADADYKF